MAGLKAKAKRHSVARISNFQIERDRECSKTRFLGRAQVDGI